MLSKNVADLLVNSNIPGISTDCVIFTGKIPKGFTPTPPTNKIVILIQDLQNAPGVHGSNLVVSKSQSVQMQIFYPSVFSENNTEVSNDLGLQNNDVEEFEDNIIKFLNDNDIEWSFGSGCLIDPDTNRLSTTLHFNLVKII